MEIKYYMKWSLVSFFIWILLTPIVGFSQETKLIPFEIEDQFDRVYTEKSWKDSILIIVGSDKDGSQYNPVWAKAIYDTLQKELPKLPVRQVGLADVSGVPFFLKGFVQGKFPEDSAKWVLMDWDGTFAESYNFVEEESNILIFDLRRILVYQTSGKEVDKIKIGKILEALKKGEINHGK